MTGGRLKSMLRWLYEKGFFYLLSANFLTQFLGFGTSLFVSKLLSPVELGEIRILQSYTNAFVVIAGFGYTTSVLKYCAENREDDQKQYLLHYSIRRTLLATLLTLGLMGILSISGVIATSQHLAVWLMVYALIIPFSVITQLLMVFLQSQKRINEMARVQVVIRLLSFGMIVLCTWLWGFRGFVFSTIAAYGVGLYPLLKQVRLTHQTAAKFSLPTGFNDAAIFSMLGMGITALGQYGDVFILDHYNTDRVAIGYYALALVFMSAAVQITATVQSIVTPYFSEKSQNELWVRSQILRNQVRLSALSIVVAIAVLTMAWVLVRLFYGPAYQPSLQYLSILLVKYILWSSYAVIGASFVGLGLIRYGFFLTLIYTPFSLLLTYILMQRFGVTGVAWAQVGAALFNFCLILVTSPLALKRYFARQTLLSQQE